MAASSRDPSHIIAKVWVPGLAKGSPGMTKFFTHEVQPNAAARLPSGDLIKNKGWGDGASISFRVVRMQQTAAPCHANLKLTDTGVKPPMPLLD